MTAGKIALTGLLALCLAIGASSTASARSSYSFGISTGPAWGGYPAYPAYPVYPAYPAYYRPAPVYSYPYYPAYPAYSYGPSFSFNYRHR